MTGQTTVDDLEAVWGRHGRNSPEYTTVTGITPIRNAGQCSPYEGIGILRLTLGRFYETAGRYSRCSQECLVGHGLLARFGGCTALCRIDRAPLWGQDLPGSCGVQAKLCLCFA